MDSHHMKLQYSKEIRKSVLPVLSEMQKKFHVQFLHGRSQVVKLEYFIWNNEYKKPYIDLFMCFSFFNS